MELVKIKGNGIFTSSLIIAEKFNKRHSDVLRAIKNLECSDEFRERNFAQSYYINAQERKTTLFAMTRDGFSFIAMGFTGKEAAVWKEKFINAFNRMEKQIKEFKSNPFKNTKLLTQRFEKNKHKIPNGSFCMIEETIHWLIMPLDLDGKDLIDNCLPDGSLGRGFCAYLRKNDIDTKKLDTYKHSFEDGRVVNAKLYPDTVLHLFKQYIRIWLKGKGKQYFTDKVKFYLD